MTDKDKIIQINSKQKKELGLLAELTDSVINTSEIPEKENWDHATTGKWFDVQVQQSIDELDVGGQLVSHDQVFSNLDAALEKKYGERTK